jgi:hypothetical protein
MMNIRLLVTTCLLSVFVAGCAGVFGSIADPGNEIRVREDGRPSPNARQEKYPITIRLGGFVDARQTGDSRLVGVSTSRILGLTGTEIRLDRPVTEVVAESLKKRLGETGMQVVEGEGTAAQFQLSGSVKGLSIDVKDRDYANIAIESTLTEASSGKVIWSGVVVEKAERFAGVSGNNKKDISDYLKKELGIAMVKTSESILSVLMSSRPELFSSGIGVKAVQGVTIYSNSLPGAASAVVPAMAPSEAVALNGSLAVSSVPSRAKVYVDGVYFGLTPLRAEIGTGVHEVNIKLDGYRTASEKVSVRKGDSTELEMKLHK